jgi:hypothetical protein
MEKDGNSKVVVCLLISLQFDGVQDKYSKEEYKNISNTGCLCNVHIWFYGYSEEGDLMVEHRNVIRLVKPCYSRSTKRGVVLTGSVSFDATVFEFFGTLLMGQDIFTNQNNLLELSELVNITKTNKVNNILTTSWFNKCL